VVGDKPELAYPEAAAELAELGHSSTLGYLQQAAGEVLAQTGLLPHINAGRPGRERRLPSRQLAAGSSKQLCWLFPRAYLTSRLVATPCGAGVMRREDMARLRAVSVSQGLMLESTSQRLMLPGGPHHGCPDKVPGAQGGGRATCPPAAASCTHR
jgi:FO synthase